MTTTPDNNFSITLLARDISGPQRGQWTYDDYAALPDDGRRYEVMNGVLIMMPAPSEPHQLAVVRFTYYLFPHVDLAGLGRLIVAPFDVELTAKRVVQPDLLVVLNARQQCLTLSSLIGPPDLAIEIASRGTEVYDRLSKHTAYEQAGVSEYWMADTEERNIEVFTLEEGEYQPLGVFQGQDTIPSRVIPGASTIAVDLYFA
jgi:Uma2 family endonuclease